MPTPIEVTHATLQELALSGGGSTVGEPFRVQFNPQTLKLNYSNQTGGGDQAGASSTQYTGRSTTKLSVELVFDTTAEDTSGNGGNPADVRAKTDRVNHFMRLKDPPGRDGKGNPIVAPPGVRFAWGAFSFDGVMESMDETLEYFSEQGVPLRATVAIGLSKQEITPFRATGGGTGTESAATARAGENLAGLIARAGLGGDPRDVGIANKLESIRSLAAGATIGGLAARGPSAASAALRAARDVKR